MTVSIVKFARGFEQLKIRLESQPVGDLRLLMLVDYWPTLQRYTGLSSYHNYFDEFIWLLLDHIYEKNLQDLLPPELTHILDVTLALQKNESTKNHEDIKNCIDTVATETARKFLFLGEIKTGLDCLARAEDNQLPLLEIPEFDEQMEQEHVLKEVYSQLVSSGNKLAGSIERIIHEWQFVREALSFEEANCLFVEKNEYNGQVRGRLRTLQGSAEYLQKSAPSDEVTFENQIKSPDDPFVGVVYNALKAVRVLFEKTGFGGLGERHIKARFGITGSDRAFTGDSIGLTAALVAYTQLLQPEILRHERFIACDATFTGGVDAAGYLQPVNGDTLKAKIERAFVSPVRYLVLPRDNMDAAQEHLRELQAAYPHRKLMLVGAGSLAEVIENRNIIRAEKVCAGQYIVRKARTFSSLAKVQVPLLIILLYVLLCLIYPKAWIGFDRNPELVELNENRDRVLVLNRDSTLLWSAGVDCPPIGCIHSVTFDLDNDGNNEVIYLQSTYETMTCPESDLLTVRDAGGKILFTRKCSILGEYPGDTTTDLNYLAKRLNVFTTESGPVIITTMVQSFPARSHIKIWSADGELLGWYIHAGHMICYNVKDVDNDGITEILAYGINNLAGGNGLFVLPLHGCYGVSPPYEDSEYDLSGVKPGNQLHYILFPVSDLSLARNVPYDVGGRIVFLPGNNIRMDVNMETDFDKSPLWRSYYIDEHFHVWKVAVSDVYWTTRQDLVKSGRLQYIDMDNFNLRELSRVKYWSGEGWISQSELASHP
jgi:hypothetical protein